MGVMSDLAGVLLGGRPMIPPTPPYQPPRETIAQQTSRVEAEQKVEASRQYMNDLAAKGTK